MQFSLCQFSEFSAKLNRRYVTITLIGTLFDIRHKLALEFCISKFVDVGLMVLIGKAVVLPQFTEYQVLYLCIFVTEVKGFPDESSVNYNVHKIVCKKP